MNSNYKLVYATDLDRTVIFSERFVNEQCPTPMVMLEVSEKTDTMKSYAHKEYVERLEELINTKKVLFVPVTSRSIAEYKRVKLSKFAKYAIVTNGCHILFNGEVYEPYEEYLRNNIIDFKKFQKDGIEAVLNITKLEKEPKIIDDAYVFAKVKDPNEDTSEILSGFNNKNEDILIERNGRKLYVTPKNVNKGTALTWLMSHIILIDNNSKIIASGDSIMDASFIKHADIKIVPQHGTILNEHLDFLSDSIVVSNGPMGTLETLDICEDILGRV